MCAIVSSDLEATVVLIHALLHSDTWISYHTWEPTQTPSCWRIKRDWKTLRTFCILMLAIPPLSRF